MTLDWNTLMGEAEDGFTLAPPGDYNIFIKEAEATTYSTGSQGIKARLCIESGPHMGAVIFNNFVIVPDKPKALGMFFRNMKILGADADFFAKSPTLAEVADHITGHRAVVTIKHREYNGQMQYDVAGLKPPVGETVVSGASVTPSSPLIPSVPKMTVPSIVPSSPPPIPPTI